MSAPRIVFYEPQYKNDFRRLNLAWIEKYFWVEPQDLAQVDHPELCVSAGGQIFFVVADAAAVGTCALYRVEKNKFELAKMAVSPDYQGLGFGNLLMEEAEKWAREHGGEEIRILSNTILEPAIRLYLKHGYRVLRNGQHPSYERCNIELAKRL